MITTDGQENSSKEFTYEHIHNMISHQQAKYSWEFLFLGANIDAVKEAQSLGIDAKQASNYVATARGTATLYSKVAQSVMSFYETGKIDDDWASNIVKSGKKKKLN